MADLPMISVEGAANLLRADVADIRELSRRRVLPPIIKGEMPLVATVQKFVEHIRAARRPVNKSGELINKSAEWVRKLIDAGFIEKQPDGTLLERDVYNGYIRWLTDEARRTTKVQAESRVRDARAREIELRIAEHEGRLIERTDMEEVVDEYAGTMRSELAGLAARVTRDLTIRRTIEQAIDEILARVAANLRQALARLQASAGADGAVADPNAGQMGGEESNLRAGQGGAGSA